MCTVCILKLRPGFRKRLPVSLTVSALVLDMMSSTACPLWLNSPQCPRLVRSRLWQVWSVGRGRVRWLIWPRCPPNVVYFLVLSPAQKEEREREKKQAQESASCIPGQRSEIDNNRARNISVRSHVAPWGLSITDWSLNRFTPGQIDPDSPFTSHTKKDKSNEVLNKTLTLTCHHNRTVSTVRKFITSWLHTFLL